MRFKRLLLCIALLLDIKLLVWATHLDYSVRGSFVNSFGVFFIIVHFLVLIAIVGWQITNLVDGDYDEWIDDNIEPIFDKILNVFNRKK